MKILVNGIIAATILAAPVVAQTIPQQPVGPTNPSDPALATPGTTPGTGGTWSNTAPTGNTTSGDMTTAPTSDEVAAQGADKKADKKDKYEVDRPN